MGDVACNGSLGDEMSALLWSIRVLRWQVWQTALYYILHYIYAFDESNLQLVYTFLSFISMCVETLQSD